MGTPEQHRKTLPKIPLHLPPFGESFRARQERYEHLWLAEADRYFPTDEEWEVATCAELADGLWYHQLAAAEDPNFEDELTEWDLFVFEKNLRLPLEQSCHQGVLLPLGHRAMRLVSCPESMMNPLRFFFSDCPRHIQAYLALYNYVAVRLDRAKRTGNPEWRPETALPAPGEHAFFRPPVLRPRNYAR